MSHSTYTLFIGVFSVALYLFMTIVVISASLFVDLGLEAVASDKDVSEETLENIADSSDAIHGIVFLILADFIVMFIASILMVYGVKKERHQYIAPWVYLSAIGLFIQLVGVFFQLGASDRHHASFAYVLSAVVSAAIWYPVFKYYQSLKHPQTVVVPASPCSAAAYEYSHVNAKYVPTALVAATTCTV